MHAADLKGITVQEVMDRWPATVAVFNARRMACPGCAVAPFTTVAECAASYGIDASELARELADRIAEARQEHGHGLAR